MYTEKCRYIRGTEPCPFICPEGVTYTAGLCDIADHRRTGGCCCDCLLRLVSGVRLTMELVTFVGGGDWGILVLSEDEVVRR
jgi:hypothetical protein